MKPKLGAWVRAARESVELSQDGLAELLAIPRPSLSEVERGRRSLSAEEYLLIQNLTGFPHCNTDGKFERQEETIKRIVISRQK